MNSDMRMLHGNDMHSDMSILHGNAMHCVMRILHGTNMHYDVRILHGNDMNCVIRIPLRLTEEYICMTGLKSHDNFFNIACDCDSLEDLVYFLSSCYKLVIKIIINN